MTNTTLHCEPITALDGAAFRVKTLHVLDVQNHVFAVNRRAGVDDVAAWWRLYREEMVGVGPDDLLYLGTSVRDRWMQAAIPADRKRHWVIGHSGPHGAEQALLASVYPGHVAKKYQRVVIGSGDGAFVSFARRCREAGMTVQVAAVDRSLHPALAAAATVRTTLRSESRTVLARRTAAATAMRSIHAAARGVRTDTTTNTDKEIS